MKNKAQPVRELKTTEVVPRPKAMRGIPLTVINVMGDSRVVEEPKVYINVSCSNICSKGRSRTRQYTVKSMNISHRGIM